MCLSKWGGKVSDAHDGGIQSMMGNGLKNVLFCYCFGLDVGVA